MRSCQGHASFTHMYRLQTLRDHRVMWEGSTVIHRMLKVGDEQVAPRHCGFDGAQGTINILSTGNSLCRPTNYTKFPMGWQGKNFCFFRSGLYLWHIFYMLSVVRREDCCQSKPLFFRLVNIQSRSGGTDEANVPAKCPEAEEHTWFSGAYEIEDRTKSASAAQG